MKSRLRPVILLLLICTSLTAGVLFANASSWEQFCYNSQHIGYTADDAPQDNATLWVTDTDLGLVPSSSVAVADGMVFAISVGESDEWGNPLGEYGSLIAFDKTSGDIAWETPIDVPEWGSWSSPAYDDGKVFVSAGQMTHCIDAETGEYVWNFTNPSGSASCNGGPAVADGKVFCSDWDGCNYYCLEESSGNLLWNFTVDGYAQGTPAYEDGKLYITSWAYSGSGSVYCVNAGTGEQIWYNNSFLRSCCGSVSVGDGDLVYATGYSFYDDSDPGLYAFDKDTGHIVWDAVIQRTDATPVLAYGNLYVCGGCSGYSESQTYCFDPLTGALKWSTAKEFDGIGDWTCSVTAADGKVFVGSPAGNMFGHKELYALNYETGDVEWSAPYAGGTAAISDGVVYSIGVDTQDGDTVRLYAFGSGSDWNPWNDPDSAGSPDGTYITVSEFIEAYNCYHSSSPAPETGASVDISRLIELYNAYRNSTPL